MGRRQYVQTCFSILKISIEKLYLSIASLLQQVAQLPILPIPHAIFLTLYGNIGRLIVEYE